MFTGRNQKVASQKRIHGADDLTPRLAPSPDPPQTMVDKDVARCYGSISLFSSILHNVFLLYHVEVFVSVYKIDKASFWIGETIFLVWNSCNDPIFGWLSDKTFLLKQENVGNEAVVLKRIKALQWSGPFFAGAFLTFWVAWTFPALQFVICLCLYDGFLTMIDLHHSALLADMTISADSRTQLNFYSSIFNALGSLSVFVSYVVWNRQQPVIFQGFCVLLAIVSLVGFLYSTRKLRQLVLKELKNEAPSVVSCAAPKHNHEIGSPLERQALRKFVQDLVGHSNFMWFSVMNLIQVFHCHFNSNFFPLFLDNLLGDSIPQVICSLILGVSFVAPHINNLYFLSVCRKYGLYSVVRCLFIVKFLLSIAMLCVGPNHLWLLCIYIASNRVFTEGTCKLLNLVISDLVDEDCVVHHRKQAVSALMFGTAALLSKPGQTLAPLVGTWLLAMHTGHDVFEHGNHGDTIKLDTSSLSETQRGEYRHGVFQLLVYVPAVCAVLQLLAWAHFTLKGERLRWVKALRQGSIYAM